MTDLTRWNRAGLSRFDYVDGNAAVFLERLRAGLAARFPAWSQAQATIPQEESEEARKSRLEALYAQDPDDMLWQLTRQFARSCHVLCGHLDAYANEATLGTASQWENLRRLVALLDYAPIPQASAYAALALSLKEGKTGTIAAGLQVKNSPTSGAPLIFETLADLEADAAWNTLYARDHQRNPQTLAGTTLELEGRLDKLKSGEPVVLENEDTGHYSAHLIEGVSLGEDSTVLTISPALPNGYRKGHVIVHALPKEKLKPIGPAATGVDSVGHSLQLSVATGDLAAGDIVVIRSGDDKPYYRRIKTVHDDRLVFHRAIGPLSLKGATVARPVSVPLAMLDEPSKNRKTEDGAVIDIVYVAGDWSRLAGEWLADIRVLGSGEDAREYLPMYECTHANYMPVTSDAETIQSGFRPGYTALTLTWTAQESGVPENVKLPLNNPQTLLAPPAAAGPWSVDSFLNASDSGRLEPDLITQTAKHTAAGDLAVVVLGAQMTWAKLAAVALDPEHEESTLTAEGQWRQRGGGHYFLSRSRVFSRFQTQARVAGWQDNASVLSGDEVVLESLSAGMKTGRALLVSNGVTTLETTLADQNAEAAWIQLADALPEGTTAGNLAIYANVVTAGQGETRAERVLGSGDGARVNQRFTLAAADLSFVADATMSAGVRADVTVKVAGETWTQVASLKDSSPSDAHYQVRIDQDGYAEIQFGDGRRGRRLPSGANNVRVSFRQGAGEAGNLAAASLTKLVKPHSLIEALSQPLACSGGADREDNADLRDNAPATLLALDRAVSLEDFAQLARGHASVWQARAFRLPPGLGRGERVRVVVMAAGAGALTAALQGELQAYLLARAQPGVAIEVADYQRLTYQLQVSIRIQSDLFDADTVKAEVTAALEAAFQEEARQLGQTLYRGEIYKVVDAVAGVENSDCAILLDAATRAALKRVTEIGGQPLTVQPLDNQALIFDATDFSVTVQEYEL